MSLILSWEVTSSQLGGHFLLGVACGSSSGAKPWGMALATQARPQPSAFSYSHRVSCFCLLPGTRVFPISTSQVDGITGVHTTPVPSKIFFDAAELDGGWRSGCPGHRHRAGASATPWETPSFSLVIRCQHWVWPPLGGILWPSVMTSPQGTVEWWLGSGVSCM
jgi:hypothetical protein